MLGSPGNFGCPKAIGPDQRQSLRGGSGRGSFGDAEDVDRFVHADHFSAAFVSVNSSTRLMRVNPSELAEMKEPP